MKTLRQFTTLLAGLSLLVPNLLSAKSPRATEHEPVTLRLELDRPVLPADTRETAIIKVALDGRAAPVTKRAPVNLALVIDKSGSMGGDKIARARDAAIEAVRRLDRDDRVTLVAFDNNVHTLYPAAPVGDGRAIEACINEITANGGTNLHGGVAVAADQLRRRIKDNFIHRVILLSDGQANVGPSSPDQLGRLGAQLVQDGISVSTIGLGLGFNEDLMTRLALRSDGNTYFAEHSEDLAGIFQRELGDVLSVVARRVVVEIEFPDGARPVRIVGREGRVEERRVIIELNQLYGGQEKFALIEVELDPAKAEASREVATAKLRYEDAVDARAGSQTAQVDARFTAREKEVVAAANKQVQADYATNLLAETKDKVVVLVDAGRRDEAAKEMRFVGSLLSSMATTYDNDMVQEVAAPAAPAAEKIATGGLSNAERKSFRAEAQQTYSQQKAE
ncbi:MAG: VWA domain-containing protein [Verrucomicrobiota bacterium]